MAKLFAGDLAQKVAYDCMQFHGGMGYIDETDIARTWRDVRLHHHRRRDERGDEGDHLEDVGLLRAWLRRRSSRFRRCPPPRWRGRSPGRW